MASERNSKPGAAATRVFAILQRQRAAVSFGDLPAQHQADARTALLGREERHEQVRRIREARALVFYGNLERALRAFPADRHRTAAGLETRIGGISQQIDQQLLELIGVGVDRDIRPRLDVDWYARVEGGNALHQW